MRLNISRSFAALVFLLGAGALPCCAASPTEVQDSINKGARYLREIIAKTHGGEKTLASLALYKATSDKETPELKAALVEVLAKFEASGYRAGTDHFYEAGVEATLLSDLDPVKYKPQLEVLVKYISDSQQENGGWDYPNGGHGAGSVGDTSVIQYACLGLWAAERAGVKVDPKVWEGVLRWHAQFQSGDGGFAYCPGLKSGDGQGNSTLNMSVNAVGSMHIAMLHLMPNYMPLSGKKPPPRPIAVDGENRPKFGFLEEIDFDAQQAQKPVTIGQISDASIDSVNRAFNFVTTRFRVENHETGNKAYYYYSLERMVALANLQKIGTRDWFQECADFLVSKQDSNGSWKLSAYYGPEVDTAFCVLFLTRSTGKLLNRQVEPGFGAGLLAGGRGLPEDLKDRDLASREQRLKAQPTEPLDKLLASLQNTSDVDLNALQQQIVETIQLGDRSSLIGQTDRLIELATNPQTDVRQTAIWAIGRSDDLNLGRYLIDAFDDPDLAIIIEAHQALCWLSRKPDGFGLAEDPLAELPPDAAADDKNAAVETWRRELIRHWGAWYLDRRPFDQRGDDFEVRLRDKLERIKRGISIR